MKYLKVVLFPFPFSRWSHSIVLKNLRWHRIKIKWWVISIQRVRTVPYFRQIAGIIYVCFVFFAAIAQAWINLHRQHMSFTQWCNERGAKSHVAKKMSGRGRRKSRNEKGNQGLGDFRFINILQLFLFISFFQLLYFIIFSYTFFTHHIYPHPRPTTHDLYHYPRHLTTLVKTYQYSLRPEL